MEYPSYKDVIKARENLKNISVEQWYFHDLWTWQWWILLAASIFPWLIWLKYRDKTRTNEILSYGLLWAAISITTDLIGSYLILWGYPIKLLPMVPPLLPADLTVIPVTFMFLYQLTKYIKAYILGSVVVSIVFAYILEPLFINGDMFILHNWNHTYSFICFLTISLILKWVMVKLLSAQNSPNPK